MPQLLRLALMIGDFSYHTAIVRGLFSSGRKTTEVWLTTVKLNEPHKPSYSRTCYDMAVYHTPDTTDFRLWQIWHTPHHIQYHDYNSVAEVVTALKIAIVQRTQKPTAEVYYEEIAPPIGGLDTKTFYAKNYPSIAFRR